MHHRFAVRHHETLLFLRTQGLSIELDRLAAIGHNNMGGDRIKSVRNWLSHTSSFVGQPPSAWAKNPVKVVPPKNRKAGLLNPAFLTHSTLRTKSLDAATHRQHAITLPKALCPSSHQYWGHDWLHAFGIPSSDRPPGLT